MVQWIMTNLTRIAGGSPTSSSNLVSRDASLRGDGSAQDPLGLAIVASAQIRLTGTANEDPDPIITFTAEVIELTGGITFGGIDATTYPGYIKVILTLSGRVPESSRLPVTGCHFPTPPVAPVGEGIFLAVPPIPLQVDAVNDDASVFQPAFGKASPGLVEVIDLTYQLVLVSLLRP